jgi:iron(III) transport system substrate-binding protein
VALLDAFDHHSTIRKGGKAMSTTKRIGTSCVVILVLSLLLSTLEPTLTFSASKEMIAAAIKEGELSWLDAIVVPPSAKAIGDAFKKEYGLPDTFKVNHERLGTGPLSTRVTEEVKANRITIDIFAAAVPTLYADLKEYGALLRYESPEYAHYTRARKVGLFYEPGYWQSAVAYAFTPVTNPKVYPKKITSWYDLLDPALKGEKLSLGAVTAGGSPLYTYIGWRKILPKSYFVEMSKQKIVYDRGSSMDALQTLTQGQVLVTVTNPFRIMQSAEQTGVDLTTYFPKEGVTLLGQPYGILAKAPHPNAARLFIDFLFGEKGMNMFIDLEGTIVIRDGMKPPDKIKKYSPPLDEITAIPMDWKSVDSRTANQYLEEFKEIFQ